MVMKKILDNIREIDKKFIQKNISDFYEYSREKNLYKFMAELNPHSSMSDTYKYFEDLINRETLHAFPIIFENNKVIGTVTLELLNEKRNNWIIGYASSPLYSGLPIIPLTIASVIWIGFNKYNVRRLEGMAQIDNLESQNLMKGLGFVEEGTRRYYYKGRENGEYLHAKIYSLFREDFTFLDRFEKLSK
jgi:RimJ/RimL family protein N-acetyltransferase